MKKNFLLLLACFATFNCFAQSGSVGIGTNNPNSSAALDIQSTDKGILIPRMSSIQRNAISNAATGLLVFDNNTGSFWFKTATVWKELIDTAGSLWSRTGTNDNIRYPAGNVGIGTEEPGYHLHLNKPNPMMGFTDSQTGELSGFISGNTKDLTVGASRVFLGSGTPGNLLLQTHAGFAVAGNVGIGKTDPAHKLSVMGTIGLYKGNEVLGSLDSVGNNLLMNAALGSLGLPAKHIVLQYEDELIRIAGNVGIGVSAPAEKLDVAGNIRTSGNIRANGNMNAGGNFQLGGELNVSGSGTNHMAAVAYGRVAADGTIETGSGNFSVTKGVTGYYLVAVEGISNANATVIASPYGTNGVLRTCLVHTMTPEFGIQSVKFKFLTDSQNSGAVVDVVSEPVDGAFTFVVFRQ